MFPNGPGLKVPVQPAIYSRTSMPERFGGAVLTIECPGCGNRMKETLNRLGTSPHLRCVGCNSLLRVDGEQVRVALAALEAAAQAMCDGGVRKIG